MKPGSEHWSRRCRLGLPLGALGVLVSALLAALVVFPGSQPAARADGEPFDLENGRAPEQLIVPNVIPAITESVSPTRGDAPLVLRITTVVTNAWFDALAPYHPTAVGVASDLGRRPASEATQANKNTALLYASYRVLNSLLPKHAEDWREMLRAAGLDPDDRPARPVQPHRHRKQGGGRGRGGTRARRNEPARRRGRADIQPRALRRLSRLPSRQHCVPLRHPSRWQPLGISDGSGVFRVQQFVTPSWA